MRAIRTLDDWADVIADLPAEPPLLPRRLVLVPSSQVAHALRCTLARGADRHRRALVGTRFATPLVIASELLTSANILHRAGEVLLRPTRLRRLFERSFPLTYFDCDLLRSVPGWDDALARTITELEGVGGAPEALAEHGGAAADVAMFWHALDAEAGHSWSAMKVLARAATLLEQQPAHFRYGPCCAVVTGHDPTVHARFLRAIPNAQLLIRPARPDRRRHRERVERLYGATAMQADGSIAAPTRCPTTERDRLRDHIFAPPELASGSITRSQHGRDGTVELEEHAGVEAEIEAAVDWVAREVLDFGTPLARIALLVPRPDPYVGLLVERLERLPWPERDGGELPVFVAGGLRLTAEPDGARWASLLRALRQHLDVASLIDLAPLLRTTSDVHLDRTAAVKLFGTLGITGGNPAHPRGALAWSERFAARSEQLQAELAALQRSPSPAQDLRRQGNVERTLQHLAALTPALQALGTLAQRVLEGAGLASLWIALCDFARVHLKTLQADRVANILNASLGTLCDDPGTGQIRAEQALVIIARMLHSARVLVGRYGEPRLYIGSIAEAQWLPFTALRILGLAEGRLPSAPREDAVLPDAIREQLHPDLRTVDARVLSQLHDLDAVLQDTSARVVLSSPRLGPDRSYREPSSVLIEAAVATQRSEGVPDRHALEAAFFTPARRALREFRVGTPLLRTAALERASLDRKPLQAPFLSTGPFSLERMRRLQNSRQAHALDGLLGADLPLLAIRGLNPDKPLSASGLQELLRCPHKFLLRYMLGFEAPATTAGGAELDALSYGSLMHEIIERFALTHGEAFGARKGTLANWHDAAHTIAEQALTALLEHYPLEGAGSADRQRRRVIRDLRSFLSYDWAGGSPRRLFAAEKAFGWSEPFALELAGTQLYLRGMIDRIDIQDKKTLLRDLKTGKPKLRRLGDPPDHIDDLQLGLYALVVKQLAAAWSIPKQLEAAYVYPRAAGQLERAFTGDDFAALERSTRAWLGVAIGLLRTRSFPRTPRATDCDYCEFKPVCGPDATERARAVVDLEPRRLSGFADLKSDPEPT